MGFLDWWWCLKQGGDKLRNWILAKYEGSACVILEGTEQEFQKAFIFEGKI